MRVVVLGASGMIGHMACRILSERHHVVGVMRRTFSADSPVAAFLPADRCIDGIDLTEPGAPQRIMEITLPDVVLNCAGIVKQLPAARNAIQSIESNALLPHRLAEACIATGARLVQFSTDCVFSGRTGNYREDDIPDPVDLYGRSKLLGELSDSEGLTLRTSFIGRQLDGSNGLLEWARTSRGTTIKGFDRAIYSGLSTMAIARIVDEVIVDYPDLSGLWHVASTPISKHELLQRIDRALELGLHIERDDQFVCDRSLDGTAFELRTGIRVPDWSEMIDQIKADEHSYRHSY